MDFPLPRRRVDIDAALVGRLIAAQFPRWSGMPVRPVEPGGWSNRTFRVGESMVARLPSAQRYAAKIGKEQIWLPRLAPHLPLPVPEPLAEGAPGEGYPWPWSVYRWIEGETAASATIDDRSRFATDLAKFLGALQRIDPADGPPPGAHSFHRGGDLAVYDTETRQAVAALGDAIDQDAVTAVWAAALASHWERPPVWLHGDVAPGNLLVRDGRLRAVIDFGGCAVGDPACDLAIAWTVFSGESREAFRAALSLDGRTWARGRGWAMWKALIVWAALPGANPLDRERSPAIVRELIEDHRQHG